MIPTLRNMVIDTPDLVPINYLQAPFLTDYGIRLGILRLDTLHPDISGNKWFKLEKNLQLAKEGEYNSLLTFGGVYSNHLAATAVAAAGSGLKSIAIVRGWHGKITSSPTLDFCVQQGMLLHFVSREEYDQKYNEHYLEQLKKKFHNPYIIPEGGNNDPGRRGCEQIATLIPNDVSHVAVPVGTGTTFCGIRNRLAPSILLHGFPVMKDGAYLAEDISKFVSTTANNWQLHPLYHFGGFARHTIDLIAFINKFYQDYSIRLDFVYTAKMLWGIFDMVQKGLFEKNVHIIAIHTGGLQGNSSIQDKLIF